MIADVSENFAFSSSVKDDVWHPQKDDKSYEWWYFDAVSDDGTEAVVVIFLDNFVYSPRYNRETTSIAGNDRCPAVSFTYFKDGKAVFRSTTEYHSSDFRASETEPECHIGPSGFTFRSASYGSGFLIEVNAALPGSRKLCAEFEWLSVESDLVPEGFQYGGKRHYWNMVSPRSDVTGRMRVTNALGKEIDERHFRGTGYHDHNLDDRWLARTVLDWHWGRAHYADCSAVYYRYREIGAEKPDTRLLMVRGGKIERYAAEFHEDGHVRDKFGIRYPSNLLVTAEGGPSLSVRVVKVIDSSFYFMRFMSEVTLAEPGRAPHSTSGISEFIAPRTLKYRWLNWLADVRTGKDNGTSYF